MVRLALIWLIALVAFGGWWILRGQVNSMDGIGGSYALAEDVPLEEVEEIELRFRDEPDLTIQRDESGWQQVEPFRVGIDTFSARQLGATAADLKGIEVVRLDEAGGPTAAQLGLEPPAATVTWRWPEGSHSIALGNRTLAGRAWARVGDEPYATLVDASLHERVLETDHRLWRDRALVARAGATTTRIVIEAGNEELQLERSGAGWRMTSPVSTRADESAIADWLARVGQAKVVGYLYDEPGGFDRFGLEVPIARIEITGKDTDEAEVILLGDPIGVGYADRYGMVWGSPTILRIDEETQRVLVPAAATLVDARGTGVVREDIARLEIRTPEGVPDLELERDFDQWVMQVDGAEQAIANTETVERLLAQLTSSRAGELAFSGYPQDLEEAVVIFYGFDGAPLDTVRIVREPEAGRWALENGDGVLRIFPASLAPPIRAADFSVPSD